MLARREGPPGTPVAGAPVFCPGVIRGVYEGHHSVGVLFDGEEQPLFYHDVLAPAELDAVVSDAVPATNQVCVSQAVSHII